MKPALDTPPTAREFFKQLRSNEGLNFWLSKAGSPKQSGGNWHFLINSRYTIEGIRQYLGEIKGSKLSGLVSDINLFCYKAAQARFNGDTKAAMDWAFRAGILFAALESARAIAGPGRPQSTLWKKVEQIAAELGINASVSKVWNECKKQKVLPPTLSREDFTRHFRRLKKSRT